MKNFTTYLGFFVFIPMMIFGQWSLRMAPAPTYLKHVFFINDSVGFAGSFSTFDAGFTWQVDTSAYANFKNAVFTDHLNGFAISDSNLFQSNDGGATWVNISDSVEITNFSNLAAKNGHVIINGFKQQVGYYWYVTVNNGQSWEMRNFHPTYNPQVCHIFDENQYYFADSHNSILASTSDGGLTWDVATG